MEVVVVGTLRPTTAMLAGTVAGNAKSRSGTRTKTTRTTMTIMITTMMTEVPVREGEITVHPSPEANALYVESLAAPEEAGAGMEEVPGTRMTRLGKRERNDPVVVKA